MHTSPTWLRLSGSLLLLALAGCGNSSGSDSAVLNAGNGQLAAGPAPVVRQDAPPGPPGGPPAPPGVDDAQLRAAMARAGVQTLSPPVPAEPARLALGQALMFDKLLSGNKDVACASCHQTGQALSDGLSVALGTGATGSGASRQLGAGRHFIGRNTPALFNLANLNPLMWDGAISRAANNSLSVPGGVVLPAGLENQLAAQALFPLLDRNEMRGNAGDVAVDSTPNELALIPDGDTSAVWGAIMQRLLANQTYVQLFQAAFPGVPQAELGIQHVGNALASFQSTRFSRIGTPFDAYVAGDNGALTEAQKRGAAVFYGGGRCAVCHTGGLLTDMAFHNIASPQIGEGNRGDAPLDFGRGTVTGAAADRFRFRTPSLRNVALTGPWMHAGAYTSLEAVVRHYINPEQALRNYNPNQLAPQFRNQVHVAEQIAAGVLNNVDPVVAPINLNNAQVADLVAFLGALTDPRAVEPPPASVPSGLPVSF